MAEILPGTLLIADPFLKDPNFLRTVVLICKHKNEGSLGFVVNRTHQDMVVSDAHSLLEGCNFPLYYGGPVQMNTIHFLHTCPQKIHDGQQIAEGIFWGGNFEQAATAIKNQLVKEHQLRFYIGYSGWGEGQLENEMNEKSWLTVNSDKKIIFHTSADMVWQEALRRKGGEYTQLIHYPIDPQLN